MELDPEQEFAMFADESLEMAESSIWAAWDVLTEGDVTMLKRAAQVGAEETDFSEFYVNEDS